MHTTCIFDLTRVDLLVLAQPCEKCMMCQVPWRRIHSHRKESHFRVRNCGFVGRNPTTDIKNILDNNYAQNLKTNGKCMPLKNKKPHTKKSLSQGGFPVNSIEHLMKI